jgi:hypothetical protein
MIFQQNKHKASSDMCVNLIQNSLNTSWVLNLGVTDHMMRDKKKLNNYKHYEGEQIVIVANEDKMEILASIVPIKY